MSGMDEFAPYLKINGCFIVLNVSPQVKTIKIFNYPIPYHQTRDLLGIPGVAEQDIRASLLKGELQHKIRAKDIIVVCSDIDLLQFNMAHKAFLQGAGIVNGLEVIAAVSNPPYRWVQEVDLIGTKNGSNRTFTSPDKFLNGFFTDGSYFHIQVKHMGKDLYETIDYTISESGGPGTGYDTIHIRAFAPKKGDVLKASYAVKV